MAKVLCALGYRPKIKELIKIVFFSFSLNLITPAKSGDLVKILAHKNIKNKSKLISGVILDRLSDLLVLSLLCLIWGLYLKNFIGIYLGLSILISLIFLIFIKKFIKINFKKKLFNKILIIFNKSFELLLNKSKYILLLIFLSFLQWFLVSFQVFFLFISFGANIPIIIIFSLFPVVVIASVLLPLTPGGLGIREISFVYLFSQFVDNQISFSVSISYYFFSVIFPGIIGLTFLKTFYKRINFKDFIKFKKKISSFYILKDS